MATKPRAKYPMIIRTTSKDDLPYADDETGVELVPLAPEVDPGYLPMDAQKLSLPRRSSTRRRGSSPDMKFIEEDESDSELVALAGIDSRESSSVPRGDSLPEYDVEELKNLLRSSSPGWIPTQPPSAIPPAKKESLSDEKAEAIVINILNHSPSGKRKNHHEYEKLTTPSETDSSKDNTYCTIRDGTEGATRVSSSSSTVHPSPSKSRSGSPETAASSSRRRGLGEGDWILSRRLHSNASVEHKEEEEQILEILRQAMRKCTNPDPMKRPASSDIFDMLSSCSTNRDHSP